MNELNEQLMDEIIFDLEGIDTFRLGSHDRLMLGSVIDRLNEMRYGKEEESPFDPLETDPLGLNDGIDAWHKEMGTTNVGRKSK